MTAPNLNFVVLPREWVEKIIIILQEWDSCDDPIEVSQEMITRLQGKLAVEKACESGCEKCRLAIGKDPDVFCWVEENLVESGDMAGIYLPNRSKGLQCRFCGAPKP